MVINENALNDSLYHQGRHFRDANTRIINSISLSNLYLIYFKMTSEMRIPSVVYTSTVVPRCQLVFRGLTLSPGQALYVLTYQRFRCSCFTRKQEYEYMTIDRTHLFQFQLTEWIGRAAGEEANMPLSRSLQ